MPVLTTFARERPLYFGLCLLTFTLALLMLGAHLLGGPGAYAIPERPDPGSAPSDPATVSPLVSSNDPVVGDSPR